MPSDAAFKWASLAELQSTVFGGKVCGGVWRRVVGCGGGVVGCGGGVVVCGGGVVVCGGV